MISPQVWSLKTSLFNKALAEELRSNPLPQSLDLADSTILCANSSLLLLVSRSLSPSTGDCTSVTTPSSPGPRRSWSLSCQPQHAALDPHWGLWNTNIVISLSILVRGNLCIMIRFNIIISIISECYGVMITYWVYLDSFWGHLGLVLLWVAESK